MTFIFKWIIAIYITVLPCVNSSKILGIFPLGTGSHYILYSKLMKGLADAGHDVTMVSPFELEYLPKNGTFRGIILESLKDNIERFSETLDREVGSQTMYGQMIIIFNLFFIQSNQTLRHPAMKKLVESNETFDVLIMEYVTDDALKIYAHIFNCPLIILNSMGPNPMINPTVGNPQPASYVPHTILSKDLSQSILSRGTNLLFYVVDFLIFRSYTLPKNDEILRAVYPDAPSIYDLYTNVSLVLLNSHTSISAAVPVVPNMVEIGGYFIDPPKKLPQDLEDYINSATEGVIYFSMGSIMRGTFVSKQKQQVFVNTFAKLKQKVIWKFEDDSLDVTPNVLIRKWCPQQDILAHPNVKLFITHGGLLSTTEAIYNGVPILAIPVFGDQPVNAAAAVQAGYALRLDYRDPEFDEEKLTFLINELLNNPKYAENAKTRSRLYHDRPQKPMETAVYWVEYVIRHRGAPHLRVAGLNLPWYKYFMLDVLGSILLAVAVALYVIKWIISKLVSLIYIRINRLTGSKKKVN